jgi:beta-ribofuranosylaminobenzene 5'-phosphate synthase
MSRLVHVTAPSRLHFGLWSLGGGQGRQFGGVGAMIDQPQLQLVIEPAEELAASGNSEQRVIAFARRWAGFHGMELPACRMSIRMAIPEHAGLGSGTQLALSVAAGLNAFCGLPSQTPQELALSVGRGLRSAVGTYGFVFGGLIVEQGKLPDEPISPLDCRIDLPEAWRFVLVRPRGMTGLAGSEEVQAFAALATVPPHVTENLIAEVRDRLVPAAATGNFAQFAETLYRYGRMAGECFAARQGGPYNGPIITTLVERIRGLGMQGVGQSSWGPTIFVACPSDVYANQFVSQLRSATDVTFDIVIARPCNCGTRIEVNEPAPHELPAAG